MKGRLILGCRKSMYAEKYYEMCERKHKVLMTIFVRGSAASMFMLFITSAISPILFAFFGNPTPDKWILPFQSQ